MEAINDVIIASKVHPNFKASIETFCKSHDYTMSQAVRRGLLLFMREINDESAVELAEHHARNTQQANDPNDRSWIVGVR